MKHQPLRSRRGFTLVECLLGMLLAVSLAGLLAAIMGRVMVGSAASGQHLERITNLGRLAEQFRHDVHAADSATVEPADEGVNRLRLNLPGQDKVTYAILPAEVTRTFASGGDQVSRETFRLPGMKALEFRQDSGGISLVVGHLAHPDTDDMALRNQFSIDATLGNRPPRGDE